MLTYKFICENCEDCKDYPCTLVIEAETTARNIFYTLLREKITQGD